ncbi:MAG TPA: Ig-like domain repeat protein [Pirellulales bacterium]|jgi:streptogramin lyase
MPLRAGGHSSASTLGHIEALEPRYLFSAASLVPEVTNVVVAGTSWSPAFVSSLAADGLGNGGYSIPVGSSAQLDSLPWQNLNQIKISFNENVLVQPSALTLISLQGGNVTFGPMLFDQSTSTVTWTLSSPLPAGSYLLVLNGHSAQGVHDSSGNALAGAWSDGTSVYPSGNGIAGTDFSFRFNVLPGDVNQDGIVNGQDLAQLSSQWAQPGRPIADTNGDQIINNQDIAVVSSAWLAHQTSPVNVLGTGISLSPVPSSITADQTITLSAQVVANPQSPISPNEGSVTFFSDGIALGSASVEQGNANLSNVSLPVGQHKLTAVYNDPSGIFATSATAAISPASTIVTAVGGGVADGDPSIDALLHDDQGIAVDSQGNIYIADKHNNRIREIDHSTGIITTVAGAGDEGYAGDNGLAVLALLNKPTAVAVDQAGDLFIADAGNDVIRKVDHATGIITTIAGTGVAGFSGDNGPATDAQLNFAYGINGATSSPLPAGLATDAAGDVFILDFYNARIRKVDHATGIITTIAGNGTMGYAGDDHLATEAEITPTGIAATASGDVFFADGEAVRKVDAVTGIMTRVFGGDDGITPDSSFVEADSVAIDAAGNLFVSDWSGWRIHEVDLTTGTMTVVAGGGTQTGDNVPAFDYKLSYPFSVAVGPAGDLYFVQSGFAGLNNYSPTNNFLRKVDHSTGLITTIAGVGYSGDGGPAIDAELNAPSDIAIDPDGNLLIADTADNVIRKVDHDTGVITTIVGPGAVGYSGDNGPAADATLHSPAAIAVDAAGDLFIADAYNLAIRKVDHSTGLITTIATTSQMSGFVAASAVGDVYFPGNLSVMKIDHVSGVISKVAGGGSNNGDGELATTAQINPYDVTVDTAGNLFIADANGFRIREVNHTTGIITTLAHVAATTITLGTDGNIFTTGLDGNQVDEINPVTGIVIPIVIDRDSALGDDGPALNASLTASGLAVDSAGNLFIADSQHDRVREILRDVIVNVSSPQQTASTAATSAVQTKPASTLVDNLMSRNTFDSASRIVDGPMPLFDQQNDLTVGALTASTVNDELLTIIASARRTGDRG